jgi:hypothetical protein
MSRSAPAWKLPFALLAAYLLVLQMVLAGFALGALAAPDSADHQGIFCSASGATEAAPDAAPDPSQTRHFDCCARSCPMLGGLLITPPAAEVSAVGFVVAPGPAPTPDPSARSSYPRNQRTARGPPGAA